MAFKNKLGITITDDAILYGDEVVIKARIWGYVRDAWDKYSLPEVRLNLRTETGSQFSVSIDDIVEVSEQLRPLKVGDRVKNRSSGITPGTVQAVVGNKAWVLWDPWGNWGAANGILDSTDLKKI